MFILGRKMSRVNNMCSSLVCALSNSPGREGSPPLMLIVGNGSLGTSLFNLLTFMRPLLTFGESSQPPSPPLLAPPSPLYSSPLQSHYCNFTLRTKLFCPPDEPRVGLGDFPAKQKRRKTSSSKKLTICSAQGQGGAAHVMLHQTYHRHRSASHLL